MQDQDAGFSLLEVLVATAILAVALSMLAHVLTGATASNALAGNVSAATILAAEKIEELRSASFPRSSSAEQDSPLGGKYLRRWWVDPLPARPDDVWVLRVIVTGTTGVGPPADARLVIVRMRRAP